MKIGTLAALTGCKITTIRFYEAKGLLPMPLRTEGGQREYSEEALKRLTLIIDCRRHGLPLQCIARLLSFTVSEEEDIYGLKAQVELYLKGVEAQRASLERIEDFLKRVQAGITMGQAFSEEKMSTTLKDSKA
ncbi:MAG TPA: MerR family transcriptional regulator [Candidatus Avisuccinivibrio pullicola]|nr:MerR family transcriptional regulator [Candidatus Avisuccinivibrio pullicola]